MTFTVEVSDAARLAAVLTQVARASTGVAARGESEPRALLECRAPQARSSAG